MKIQTLFLLLLLVSCAQERPPYEKFVYFKQAFELIRGSNNYATITLRSADYSSGGFKFVNTFNFDQSEVFGVGTSDINVQCNGRDIYRIQKYGHDTLTKYSFDSKVNPVWQRSTMNGDDGAAGENITSSNPYNLAFDSNGRAFLTRFDSSRMWEVFLNSSSFKGDSIDYLSYADSDTKPEQVDAKIHGDNLITLLARIERSGSVWQYTYQPILSVINKDDFSEVKKLTLNNKNPSKLKIKDDKLFIGAQGDLWDASSDIKGGIEIINLTTLEAEDNILTDYKVTDFVVEDDAIYFLNFVSFGSVELNKYDLTSKEVTVLKTGNLTSIAALAGSLWVGDADSKEPKIHVYKIDGFELVDQIKTNLVPQKIEFCAL